MPGGRSKKVLLYAPLSGDPPSFEFFYRRAVPDNRKTFFLAKEVPVAKICGFFSILWYELPPPAGTVIPEMQNEAMAL